MTPVELRQELHDLIVADLVGPAGGEREVLADPRERVSVRYLAGMLAPRDSAYERGLQWLTKSQHADGSWHVRSRSKPFQSYFESGYPHGKDQFISITAACWATTALLLSLPVSQ